MMITENCAIAPEPKMTIRDNLDKSIALAEKLNAMSRDIRLYVLGDNGGKPAEPERIECKCLADSSIAIAPILTAALDNLAVTIEALGMRQ